MTVRVEMHSESAQVWLERLGYIGFIRRQGGQYVFNYNAYWEKLTFAENAAVQEAVKNPIAVLNVTARLKGK